MLFQIVSMRTQGPKIIVITGPVGSGETSLLLAILGELPLCRGFLERKGKMAFVKRLPRVFSGTLHDNITFNKAFDSSKFQRTVARPLYSDADVYLLDDPLNCIDARVGRHFFDKYIRNALRNLLCSFVTHEPCYVKQPDHIIVMNEGSIAWQGSYSEMVGMEPGGIASLNNI